jgi:hypothetical protein
MRLYLFAARPPQALVFMPFSLLIPCRAFKHLHAIRIDAYLRDRSFRTLESPVFDTSAFEAMPGSADRRFLSGPSPSKIMDGAALTK